MTPEPGVTGAGQREPGSPCKSTGATSSPSEATTSAGRNVPLWWDCGKEWGWGSSAEASTVDAGSPVPG